MTWQLAKAFMAMLIAFDIPAELMYLGKHDGDDIFRISIPLLPHNMGGEYDPHRRMPGYGRLSQDDANKVMEEARRQELIVEGHDTNLLIY